jgi:hypothetical protein
LTPEVLKRPRLRYLDVQDNASNTGFTAEISSLATASRSKDKATDFQAKVQLPVSEAASATGAVVMVGNLADPAVTIQRQGDHGLRKQFVAPGEQVYAVQYRKVKFKWYSSRDLDRAALEKGSRWMVHGTVRGQEVGTNDVVEATISEEEDADGEEIVSPNQADNS